MYHTIDSLKDFMPPFPLETIAPLEQILFLDIETTGLSASYNRVYMIGLSYYKDYQWFIEQCMTEHASEEQDLLLWLSDQLSAFSQLIHFNGNRFDLPFLKERAARYGISFTLDSFVSTDIFKKMQDFKSLLVLPDCRQKTLEQFLNINRIDKYTGGELIQIYKAYESTKNPESLQLLLQHNYDDMKGMLEILPILAYPALCETALQVTRVQMQRHVTVEGHPALELVMEFKLPFPLPKKLFLHFDGCFVTITEHKGLLKVPVIDKELKFFYSNFKDYYYLPEMDAAFHKSIAGQVPPSMREQAVASTCYTRKQGVFLKQYTTLVEPFFKNNYKEQTSYFELTEETKTNRELFNAYCAHIVQTIIVQNK